MPAWTRSEAVGGFAAAAFIVIVLLTVGAFSGPLPTNASCSTWFTLGGTLYCGESVALSECGASAICPPLANLSPGVTFHGVLFRMGMVHESGGAGLVGTVTVLNNTTYRVQLYVFPTAFSPVSLNWTSPDGSVAVWWPAPFYYTTPGGAVRGNATFAVAAP